MNKLTWQQLFLLIIFILLISFAPVVAEDNLITLKVRDADIKDVLVMLAKQSKINLVPENNLQGKITIDLNKVKIEKAIKILTKNYNYRFRKTEDNTYIVSKSPRDNLNVSVINGKVTMFAKNAGMDQVLRSISNLSNANMILFGSIRKKVDVKLNNIPVKRAIKLVLSGSNYTYKKENGIYLIGEKNINSPTSSLLTSSELISLDYLKAEKIPKMLPGSIPSSIIKVIKEQNAIMVTGTRDDIIKVKNYVKKIDQKAPQIVVEALIINITHKKSKNPIFNIESQSDASGKNTIFKSNLGKLTYNSITNLPSEFYVELQSMIEKGEASVRANPNVTTLNGHEANIEVSDVKYYETSHENSEGKKQTEYKSLDVGVSLRVTPWVSNSGGITLDLKPEVSSLSTKTGPEGEKGPPDIIRRQASTTVRVNNGETIVLGGLMRNSNKQTSSKVPILGDIPLVGNLFRRKISSVDKTELVIYITPYILKKKKKNNEVSMQEMLKKAKKVNVD